MRGGGVLLFAVMSALFFRWYRHEAETEPDGVLALSGSGEEAPGA